MKNIIAIVVAPVVTLLAFVTVFIVLGGSPAAEWGVITGSHTQWDIQYVGDTSWKRNGSCKRDRQWDIQYVGDTSWVKGDGYKAAIFTHKGKKVLAYDADSEEGWRKVRAICKQHPDIKHVRISAEERVGHGRAEGQEHRP